MPLHSDLTIEASRFKPEAVSEPTRQLNEKLMQLTKGEAGWWQVWFTSLIFARMKTNDDVGRCIEVQRNEKDWEDCSSKTRLSRVCGNILGALQRGWKRYSLPNPKARLRGPNQGRLYASAFRRMGLNG